MGILFSSSKKLILFIIVGLIIIALLIPSFILLYRYVTTLQKVQYVNSSAYYVIREYKNPNELIECLNSLIPRYPQGFGNDTTPIESLTFEVLEEEGLFEKSHVDGKFWYASSSLAKQGNNVHIKVYAYQGLKDRIQEERVAAMVNHMVFYHLENQITGNLYHTCLGEMAEASSRDEDKALRLFLDKRT